jgi:hypothetical protein
MTSEIFILISSVIERDKDFSEDKLKDTALVLLNNEEIACMYLSIGSKGVCTSFICHHIRGLKPAQLMAWLGYSSCCNTRANTDFAPYVKPIKA